MEDNKVICSFPFFRIYNNLTMQAYTPCCWATIWKSETNPRTTLPIDHFTGEEFNRLRREMLQGEKTEFLETYCGNCWKQEAEVNNSPRKEFLFFLDPPGTRGDGNCLLDLFNTDGTMKDNDVRFISLAINIYGNSCNLQCYECLADNSSSRISVIKKINDPIFNKNFHYNEERLSNGTLKPLEPEQVNRIVDEIVSYGHKIHDINIVGGEPMLMRPSFKLLDKLIETGHSKNIGLAIVSNMTLMTVKKMKKYFDEFMFIGIQWSVDAIRERNHWLRYPTDWDLTIENVKEVKAYLEENNKGQLRATVTPSLFSITSLEETSKWLFENNYEQLYTNFVREPEFLSPQHLPQELKDEIGPKVLKISNQHWEQLMKERNEDEFNDAIRYADVLDKDRGTNWRTVFPEIAKYAN